MKPALEGSFWTRWFLPCLFVATFPLSLLPPVSWGWENGVLENLEVAVGVGALGMGAWFWRRAPHPARVLGLCAMAIWMVAVGRELSWGAVFLEPLGFDEKGPIFSSRVLSYKPIVHPLVGLILAATVAVFLRFRLGRLCASLVRQGRFPWIDLAVVLAAGLGSQLAEGHLVMPTHGDARLQVLEEALELLSYFGLGTAQWRVFRALTDTGPESSHP